MKTKDLGVDAADKRFEPEEMSTEGRAASEQPARLDAVQPVQRDVVGEQRGAATAQAG